MVMFSLSASLSLHVQWDSWEEALMHLQQHNVQNISLLHSVCEEMHSQWDWEQGKEKLSAEKPAINLGLEKAGWCVHELPFNSSFSVSFQSNQPALWKR